MSTRKSAPDILDDILGAVDGEETIVEMPIFQPATPASRRRAARPKVQPATAAVETPQAAPPVPIIVKPVEWEYREVVFRDYRGWRVRLVDGRERDDWKNGPTLLEYLTQAGKDGWELVSMSDSHHFQKVAYLKRVKP